MRFEARDLKPYAAYVRASELVLGRIYFRVSFLDEAMIVPELCPLVFVGRDLQPEEPGVYFQDAASYFAGERHDQEESTDHVTSGEHAAIPLKNGRLVWFEVEPSDEYTAVCEFEMALEQLLCCSLRRQDEHRGDSRSQ